MSFTAPAPIGQRFCGDSRRPASNETAEEASTMYERILVAIDGSPCSDRALEEATTLATAAKAHLRILHVVDLALPFTSWEMVCVDASHVINAVRDGAARMLREAASRARSVGLHVDTQLMEVGGGRISDRITAAASEFKADIIIVGSHGRSGLSRVIMGSVSDALVRTAPVPVLVVRRETTGAAHEKAEGAAHAAPVS
jgi:nucleotide-binding universal stress UspA family protein